MPQKPQTPQTPPTRPLLSAGPFSAHDGEGRQLFDGVEIRLEEARLTVLEGPSGSGKTTLLRQVAGLQIAAEARRELCDEVYSGSELSRWRAQVTLLAQDAPMVPGSVLDNLRFPYALCASGERSFPEAEARRLLGTVGLDGLALDREARTISGGERHRLALVRGLLWDPPVLLADEPLSGLDADAAAECFELLLAHARRPGRAVLCTLHHRALAGGADLRFRLRDGHLEAP